jgi:hypothetical protein
VASKFLPEKNQFTIFERIKEKSIEATISQGKNYTVRTLLKTRPWGQQNTVLI